jgi:hypothetical protein
VRAGARTVTALLLKSEIACTILRIIRSKWIVGAS